MHPEDLLKFAGGGLDDRFGIVSFELVTQIDSSQMEIDYIADVVIAMSWFYENLSNKAKTRFCGFFVTHGTDTLTQSSTYANVMLGANYPFSVGFVAAQKTVRDKFSDVGVNFTFGLNMLSELRRSRRQAVFATAGGTSGGAYIPAASIKVSDTDVNAFDSPGKEKLMDVSNFVSKGIDNAFIETNESTKTVDDIFQPVILRGHVPISTMFAKIGLNPVVLYEHVKSIKDLAIILVTYGGFTFSPKQVDAIVRAARENNAVLFAANPFPTGSTEHLYAEALYLKEQGITPIHCLEHAAYAKVKWAQAVWGNDIHKIKMFLMGNNFMGEQPYIWEPPLEVIEELSKPNGFKIRKIGQPMDSLVKV
ncbi:MAG: asparaginase [Candidatus Peribacteria bacterium]|nr:MAG: asparaginase [Candidatus Peribacteria bacterium]